jgi:hypothetical protein
VKFIDHLETIGVNAMIRFKVEKVENNKRTLLENILTLPLFFWFINKHKKLKF